MRFSRTAVLTTVAVLGLAGVSFAQRQGGGFGGRGPGRSIFAIAGNEAVQKEVGIGADLKEKIKALADTLSEEVRKEAGTPANLREASPEEQRAAIAKLTEVRAKLEAKHTPKLKEVLSADQFKRVKEIHIQDQGALALNNAEFAKELGVGEDQQKKIADIVKEYGEKTRGLFQGGGGGGESAREKMQALNKERDEKVVGTLDAGQKEKFEAAKGKAFDVAQLRQGGPGGGGRGQRPQN